jgi:hypothetical protein
MWKAVEVAASAPPRYFTITRGQRGVKGMDVAEFRIKVRIDSPIISQRSFLRGESEHGKIEDRGRHDEAPLPSVF